MFLFQIVQTTSPPVGTITPHGTVLFMIFHIIRCKETSEFTLVMSSIHSSIHPFIHPSIHPSIHSSIHPFIHPSMFKSGFTCYMSSIFKHVIHIGIHIDKVTHFQTLSSNRDLYGLCHPLLVISCSKTV